MDNLQPLSSATATMAMQQAMLAAHDDSLDGTEEEEEDEEDEDEMEEEEEEEEELEGTGCNCCCCTHTSARSLQDLPGWLGECFAG